MSEYVKFAPVVSTTAALIGGLAFSLDETPNLQNLHFQEPYQVQENEQTGTTHTQYHVTNTNQAAFQKIETIHKFAANLLENIEDLDPEFSKAIDENYWDLI